MTQSLLRWFETIQQQFLVEVDPGSGDPARHQVAGLEDLNDLLEHWVRQVYHQRVHSETGQAPQARYAAAGPAVLPDAAALRAAFSWSAVRLVRKTSVVELEGNRYLVDPFLVGRKVELVFDPHDLTKLEVWWAGRKVGAATPLVIGRHAHPKAPPDEDPQPVEYTGIDYLALVARAGHAGAAQQLRLSSLESGGDSGGSSSISGHDERDGGDQ